MKICTKCKTKKEDDKFSKDKRATSGLQSFCKMCQSNFRKLRYSTDLSYKEKTLQISRNYKKNHTKEIAKKRTEYRKINNEKEIITKRKYYLKNKIKINKERKKYQKERRKNDHLYKLKGNIRNLIGLSFRKNGFTKTSKTQHLLGCTFEEFKKHIESQFFDWMNWNNYGKYNGEFNYGWEIDHIIPLYKANTEDEVVKLNHFSNLQPLCCRVNRGTKNQLSQL